MARRLSVGADRLEAPGTYAVIWTVIAADTHPSRGEFTFNVGHASPVRAPGLGRRRPRPGVADRPGAAGAEPVAAFRADTPWAFGAAIYCLFVAHDSRPLRLAGVGRRPAAGRRAAGACWRRPPASIPRRRSTAMRLPARWPRRLGACWACGSPPPSAFGRCSARCGRRRGCGGRSRRLGLALALVDATAAHAIPALPQPLGAGAQRGACLRHGHLGGRSGGVCDRAGRRVRAASPPGRRPCSILSGIALALLHFGQLRDLMTTDLRPGLARQAAAGRRGPLHGSAGPAAVGARPRWPR